MRRQPTVPVPLAPNTHLSTIFGRGKEYIKLRAKSKINFSRQNLCSALFSIILPCRLSGTPSSMPQRSSSGPLRVGAKLLGCFVPELQRFRVLIGEPLTLGLFTLRAKCGR